MDEVELIHMNGRIYDYNIGRFLSVDPFIQGTGSQGINPYSYVLNNPLSFTDPTGYTVEAEVDEVKTKKVAKTGSRLRTETETTTSGTVNMADGSSRKFSITQTTNSNSNGSETSVSLSARIVGGGEATDIGSSLNKLNTSTDQSNVASTTNMKKGNETSVDAKWRNIEQDEDGIITKADIHCNISCQNNAAYGKLLEANNVSINIIRQQRSNAHEHGAWGGIATAIPLVFWTGASSYVGYTTASTAKKHIYDMSFCLLTTLCTNSIGLDGKRKLEPELQVVKDVRNASKRKKDVEIKPVQTNELVK
ncbi:RHS repeat-associated core domain-containing protein [Glaciecola siphonariae]|uniref:RHS repeat-associated core domain-containing protein n=1 Tax=Glaciecola siphonariae TaxID=521012 RepID=A0ABV9LYC8_9ALTE